MFYCLHIDIVCGVKRERVGEEKEEEERTSERTSDREEKSTP